jgi:hypothetical protein
MTKQRDTRTLSQTEIERDIAAISDELESQTYLYKQLAVEAAEAESDYKLKFARSVIGQSAMQSHKLTASDKQARAEVLSEMELRVWKIAEARRNATKEALLSLRARLDALRSLAANVRYQTGSF